MYRCGSIQLVSRSLSWKAPSRVVSELFREARRSTATSLLMLELVTAQRIVDCLLQRHGAAGCPVIISFG
jgi:hypothetical protein